jgi:hypothetical protein
MYYKHAHRREKKIKISNDLNELTENQGPKIIIENI